MANPAIAGPVYNGSNTTPSTSFTSGWGTISQTGLTLSNFVQYSFATGTFGAATPNLTDPIYFGLGSISTNNSQIINGTGETDFANLSISDGPLLIDSTFSDLGNYQVVEFNTPEPSTMLLLGSGLVGLCWKGRKAFTQRPCRMS